LGAVLNYFYLTGKAREIEMVSFIGIKPGLIIGRGERLLPDNLVQVRIPNNAKGNLPEYAFLWTEKSTVENMTTWRMLGDDMAGTLLLRSDLKPPPPALELAKDETLLWIPADAMRNFVPALISPGDMIAFKVPAIPTMAGVPHKAAAGAAAAAGPLQPKPEEPDTAAPPEPAGPTETIGPFKVLAVGNRLGSAEVAQAARLANPHENLLGLRVSKSIAGEQQRADKLWDRLQAVNFRQVGIILLPRP
jgi:hypothetical protein